MSYLSPKPEASTQDEIDLLTALSNLSVSGIGQAIRKSSISGFENISIGSGGNFYQLLDVPQTYIGQAGKIVKVKTDETGLEFGISETLGVSAFTSLTDTFASYTGKGGQFVRVKAGETGLETATIAGGGDVLGPATNTDGYIPLWDGTDSKTLKNGIANASTNWNTAYGWGNHASAGYLTALTGAVLISQATPQTIGATGTRLAMLWVTDITCTNKIAGSITGNCDGNAGTVTNATLTTALTVNTGTLTLTAAAANTSVLTIGAGAVSVSGANTGDQTLSTLGAQAQLNGTGFVKASGTTISYDNSTYLTAVTAHNLLSTTHGDTTADTVVRGDIITGQGATPKWVRLAFPATPTGKVLIATATDVAWSTSALGTAAYAATGDFLAVGGKAADSDLLDSHDTSYFQTALTFGIADTNKVQINAADVADNDYAKFTATGLEGRSYSEVLSDIGAAAALSGTINEIAYFNSATTIASLAVATYPSLTELTYLKGVTSAIQTQMDLKAPLVSPNFTTPTIGGVAIPSISSTNTLTNKNITPRILSATNYTTDTGTSLNCDNLDQFIVTAQAGALLINNPTGTPINGQKLIVAVTGTAARALTYGNQFEASTVSLPTTTVTTARLNMGFIWRADTSKWVIVASA